MALTLTRLNDLRSAQDEEEEKKKKTSGSARLKAAMESETVPQPTNTPEAKTTGTTKLSGSARLQAAMESEPAKTNTETQTPQVSNTYREVDKAIGRIRTRSADLSTPSWQDDPEEMAAELNMLGATLEDTGSKLTTLSKSRAMANSAVQNIGNEIKAYETKLGMLADTMANSTDPEERQRAQQESKALDLYYQKAKLAQERYTARANELNSQFDTLAGQYESALQEYQTVEPKYTRRLGLGDSKAAEYEKQAEELRKQADSLYRSGQANYTLMRQAEQAEANAQKERQNYAQYLYSTEGEDKAMKYATGVEEGNRRKEEATNFGQKVLNTVAGAGANWFSNFGGSPLILMAELMGMHDEAEALRANDQFSSTAQEMKRNAGKVGGMLIDTAGAAGHMMSTAAFGGMAANALANTSLMSTLTGIAESSPLVTSSAARAGAKLATGLMGEFIGNAGNAAISLSSGVNGFNEARENGASYDRALANGISKGVLEYLSNKLSAGMPFENSAEQKGLMNQAVEYLAGKLGASEVLKKFGGTIVGKAVGKAWDIFGEGLEEVVTGIGDPIIDYLTYDKTADWRPKIDKLVEDFEGGVLLSLLMTGGEAALSPTIEKSAIVDQLVRQGVDKKTAQSWATPLYQEMKAMERIQKAVEDAYQQPVLQQMADKLSAGQQLSGQDARKILADPEAKQTLIDAGLITGREINDSAGRTKVAQAAEQYIRNMQTQETAEQQTTPPVPVQAEAQAEQQTMPPVPQTEPQAVQAEAQTETQAQTATVNAETPPVPQAVQTPSVQQNAPQATETPGSKTIQKALATARQKAADKAESLQSYGFTTAGAEATARVQNEQSWDAEEKAVAQALRDAGYEPTFTVGLIENAEGDSVPYLVEGNKIAIRADGRQSIQTLAEQAVGQTLNIDQSARTQAMADINKARETAKVETPKAETPKVSARYQAAVDSAKAAGASEEAGALAGRLADITGRDIRFFNEAEREGAWKNGYTKDGVIYINAQAKRPVAWVVAHELTHNVEHSKIYDKLKKLAQKELGLNYSMKVQSRMDASARIAKKLGDDSIRLKDTADAEREIVADFFADKLLTDEAAIKAVCEYEPATARSIRDYIKSLLRKLGGKETTLEKAVSLYNKALKDVATKAQAEAENKLKLKGTETQKQERGVQYSAEDEKYAEAQAKYQGKPMAGTEEFYTYDFLKSLPDLKIVYAPSIDDLYGKDGFTKQDVIQKGKSNAAETGEERGEYVYAKNNYTGRDIRVTSKGLRHGLQGKNFRILTNARMGAIAGDLIKNAVPINKLTPDTDDPNVKSTYAMAAYVQDEIGHEYVAILTIDQRDESLVDIDLVDVLHSVNGRYRNSSRVGTKPQGFNPSTTAKVSVADFLNVVNECFQSILSKDVYENLNKGEGERAKGYYTGRRVYSAEDSDDEYRQTPETPALEKLGIRLAASKGKYHLAEQLLERDKAAKALMRATKKAEKKLNATKAEKEFAAGIAAGIYEERDIPKSMNRDKVTALADYYAAEDSFKENMLAEVRDRINGELKQEAEDLLLHGDFNFKKLSMLQLNERTPDRTFRAMFGTQKGKEIFDWLIRPVQMNEAEKTRWHQKQLDRVRKFEDSKGKTRALTRKESELTMLVMEGKAAAAAVADMEKKGLDAKGIRNAAENIRNGSDPNDAAWEFGLKDKEREIAKNYARWMDTQDKLKDADSKIIETAAETYSQIFDEFYDAINDFLVAHGYEPIGYIKGYAPHMQPEETQNLLEKAFDKLGIDLGNEKAQGLPASIAGETAYFKPNKRWDPYFLHRTGTQAEYDIEKAYQSYVGYLSDILYHTDDIMRVRNFEKMLRKTYAPDEIREDLDMIQVIRDARAEDRQGMLRNQGKIGKTTQLSAQEVSEKLDEWEESLYNALKEDRDYNNLVMWLSNYANILAGKQSFADRGWEYSLGRNSLNFANRLQAAFQRSLVAGSLSSAINQTAQLPMIKTELGDRWYYQAALDILRGNTKNFWRDSDFLTGKHGVDMLTTENWDKFINALYTPSTVVDNIVSTIAVRGAYLKAVNQGQSYSEAMKTADDFGRKVMGSREKGTRPLAYESKGFFSRMVHMFQVEAANSWDHIASDLPYEIKEITKTQGKGKAAKTLAALLLRGLLSTFLLNRITEEVYGGTPAPFDVIGLAMNFVASGKGMTTNKYLKTIIDNTLEKIGQDRFFGTEDVDTEFDVGKGLKELGYNVMNDVPLLRNLAGVLGLGDQTVALPGASGELADMYDAAKNMIEEGADGQSIENLIRASAKFGAQFVPAGRQAMKTGEGIDAVIRGGSYNKKGNLQYPIDTTADKVKAILFGKNATNAAKEHWASGESTMSEKQTGMVAKLRGQGMTGTQAQDAARTVKSFSGDNKWNQTVAYIDRLNITDGLKDDMYIYAGYKESTLDKTPWHKGGSSGSGKTYAKSGLRIPTPERVETQSKPRIRTETTTATISKPRIRTT